MDPANRLWCSAICYLLVMGGIGLSGCSSVPRAGTLHRAETFVHDGQTRTYNFYETDAAGPRPLILLLHGGGGQIDRVMGLGASRWPHQVWLDIADEEGLHILVPQGINKQWNDCRVECLRCGNEDDFGFLMRLLDHVEGAYAIDRAQIFVLGESNGGFMTQRLAVEAPERFAAYGVIIALLPTNSDCAEKPRPVSIMYQVGTTDKAIAYEGGANNPQVVVESAEATLAYWRTLNQCAEGTTVRNYPDLDPEDQSTVRREDVDCPATGTAISFVTLDGAGHVPPSVEVPVSGLWERVAGIQNHDVESARLLWDFFSSLR